MKDKKLILEAIDNYDLATRSQNTILSVLVNVSINDIATITPVTLSKMTEIRRVAVYGILKRLEQQNFITILKEHNAKIGTFKINRAKLEEIKEIYQKRKNI
jgi:DNA-binding PadR family transcriptional regulator